MENFIFCAVLTMRSSFETVFIDTVRLLTDRNNRYANRDKSKRDSKITLE